MSNNIILSSLPESVQKELRDYKDKNYEAVKGSEYRPYQIVKYIDRILILNTCRVRIFEEGLWWLTWTLNPEGNIERWMDYMKEEELEGLADPNDIFINFDLIRQHNSEEVYGSILNSYMEEKVKHFLK